MLPVIISGTPAWSSEVGLLPRLCAFHSQSSKKSLGAFPHPPETALLLHSNCSHCWSFYPLPTHFFSTLKKVEKKDSPQRGAESNQGGCSHVAVNPLHCRSRPSSSSAFFFLMEGEEAGFPQKNLKKQSCKCVITSLQLLGWWWLALLAPRCRENLYRQCSRAGKNEEAKHCPAFKNRIPFLEVGRSFSQVLYAVLLTTLF